MNFFNWNRRHEDAAELNLSMQLLVSHAREGHSMAANVEGQQIERLTGVLAWQAVQMAREVIAIQNGVM